MNKSSLLLCIVLLASCAVSHVNSDLFVGEHKLKQCLIELSPNESEAKKQLEQIVYDYKDVEVVMLTYSENSDLITYERFYMVKEAFDSVPTFALEEVGHFSIEGRPTRICRSFDYSNLEYIRFYPSSCFDDILSKNIELKQQYIENGVPIDDQFAPFR